MEIINQNFEGLESVVFVERERERERERDCFYLPETNQANQASGLNFFQFVTKHGESAVAFTADFLFSKNNILTKKSLYHRVD